VKLKKPKKPSHLGKKTQKPKKNKKNKKNPLGWVKKKRVFSNPGWRGVTCIYTEGGELVRK
jgi:hypothetical protein